MKQILALPNLQFNIELLFQMMTQELAIPQVLGISKFPRGTTQVLRQNIFVVRQKPGDSSHPSGITQAFYPRFIISLDPILNCPQAVTKQRNNLCT
jgi:hypothetical protein